MRRQFRNQARSRPVCVEPLERRNLPAASLPGFLTAVGFGVTGTNSSIHANAVTTDAAGDTVVTGSFRGTISLGGASSGTTFTTAGTQDTFIAMYSPTGSLLWGRTFAGQATANTTAVSQGTAITLDGVGNVYLVGSFQGSVNFGTTASPAVVSNSGALDPFVARLDGTGRLVWMRDLSPRGGDAQGLALALDSTGGLIVAGTFEQSIVAGTTTLLGPGASEAFAVRFDIATATPTWSFGTQGSAGSNAQATGVAVDAANNVVLAGFYSGTVSFGGGISGKTFTAAGSNDAVVWKLDSKGSLLWSRSFGSTDYDIASGVAVDSANNIAVVGTFSGSVNFATGTQPDTLIAGPLFDPFVLKLDSTGQESWVRGYLSTTGWAKGQAIAVDPFNRIHVAGALSGTADFDPGPRISNLTSQGSTDAFNATLTSTGDAVTAVQAGRTNFNTNLGIAVNAAGVVALTGTYSGSISFGSISLPANGTANGFVVQLQTQPTATPIAPVLASASTTGTSNTTTNTTPTFNVVATDPVDTIQLLRDGAVVAQRIGTGALLDPGPVVLGKHEYTTIQVSLANIVSAASPALTVSVVPRTPTAPTGLALLAADDSGTLGDGLTNVRLPHITGKADAGITVQILAAAGTVLGTTTAASDGTFVVGLSSLSDGTYALQAIAMDASSNPSTKSNPFSLTILANPPLAPAALGLLLADDSGTLGDGKTNVQTPRITGRAGAGLVVQILSATGTLLGTTTAASDGTFVTTLISLGDGSYAVQAVARDLAANQSGKSQAFGLIIQTTLPTPPGKPGLLAADDSGTLGDGKTNIRSPRLTGSAPAGQVVKLVNAAGSILGTATSVGGSYTISAGVNLTDGTYPVRAVTVDDVGNTSAASAIFTLVILATPPPVLSSPTIFAADDTGVRADGLTTVRRPRITGHAAPGNQVDWLDSTGKVVTSTTASATDGSYILQAPRSFPNGQTAITVRQTDLAGNVGLVSAPLRLTTQATSGDYFGTDQTNVAVYRPWTSTFYISKPAPASVSAQIWGIAGDVPVSGDFFGDGTGDIAVFRPSTATFYILDPTTNAQKSLTLGTAKDIPVPGDYDGDGKTDFAVFRPSTGTFFIQMSSNGAPYSLQFGASGDIPVSADYFGFGNTDIAVFRPSTSTFFWIDPMTAARGSQVWGTTGDTPVPADYDGDGKTDLAIYRPANNAYFVQNSTTGKLSIKNWGIAGDVPVAGDYFGYGRSSWTVYRPSTSTFYSTEPVLGEIYAQQFGISNDRPIQPPLSSNFTTSGTAQAASQVRAAAVNVLIPLPVPLGVEPMAGTTTNNLVGLNSIRANGRTATADQAIADLSLERWRVDR